MGYAIEASFFTTHPLPHSCSVKSGNSFRKCIPKCICFWLWQLAINLCVAGTQRNNHIQVSCRNVLSHQGKVSCKQAGERATKDIFLGIICFSHWSWGIIPFSVFRSQGNKLENSGLACKFCSLLLKKSYEFSKCKRFQIKLIYFSDLVAHLRNYVLLKTWWLTSSNPSPCRF